jgi:hypothetical protein
MRTVITPEALASSKTFRKVTVAELNNPNATHDEAFVFRFPSLDIINEENGDGDLIEIIDWNHDLTEIDLDGARRPMVVTADTMIFVRD